MIVVIFLEVEVFFLPVEQQTNFSRTRLFSKAAVSEPRYDTKIILRKYSFGMSTGVLVRFDVFAAFINTDKLIPQPLHQLPVPLLGRLC